MMTCMKCGKAIALGQAFCKDCLEDMEHYPVNPGTPVQIPTQPPVTLPRRTPRTKKAKKPEEQILRLRKIIRRQGLIIFLLMVMLIVLGIYTLTQLNSPAQPIRPGENYITTDVSQQQGPMAP